METYIVIFETKKKTTANSFIAILKSLSGWGKITDNAWVVNSYQTASEIRDHLYEVKGSDDTIFVVRSGAVAAWSNVAASNKWLKKYL